CTMEIVSGVELRHCPLHRILSSMVDQNEFFKPWIVLDEWFIYSENNCGVEWKVGPFSEFKTLNTPSVK
ncbi:hypothetical protein EJB05_02775, partial [Eragrostis curvula]